MSSKELHGLKANQNNEVDCGIRFSRGCLPVRNPTELAPKADFGQVERSHNLAEQPDDGGFESILILTGAALLFVSRGTRGWIPVGLGVGLVALMAFLTTVLASQVMVYALVAGLILTVILAVLNFKEIRSWIKS